MTEKFKKLITLFSRHDLIHSIKILWRYLWLNKKYRNIQKHLHIETTGTCNLNCEFCSLKEKMPDKEVMDFSDFKRLGKYFKYTSHIRLSGIAEPLMNKKITDFITFIKEKNKKCNVSIITNATLLTEKISRELVKAKLDSLSFSIESINPLINDKIRKGASLEKILHNIRYLNKIKEESHSKVPQISTTIVLQKKNYKELPKIISKLSEFQVKHINFNGLEPYTDSSIKDVLWLPENKPDDFDNIISQSLHIAKTKKINLIIPGLKPSDPFCLEIFTPIILPNGDVSPCSVLTYDRNAYYRIDNNSEIIKINGKNCKVTFGNVFKENLEDIMEKKEYVKFRENVYYKKFPKECENCLIKHQIICRVNYNLENILNHI